MTTTHTDRAHLAPPRIEDLGGGLYAYIQPNGSWMINNTGFLVSGTGVVSVDGCATERRTRAYLDAITTVTPLPVRTLVNTHSHVDHVTGNALFAGATIVGHEKTREDMLAFRLPPGGAGIWEPFDAGTLPLAPPFLTFRDPITIWVDDLAVEVSHVGRPAHTTNDSIIWVPERRVLYSGDLVFNGGTPFCVSGSIAGLIAVLTEQILPLEPDVIVPGHGDLCGPETIGPIVEYLRLVQRMAADGIAAGLSPLDAARETDLGRFAEWTDPERIVGNLHRAYAEALDRPFAAPEMITALTDMVTYNGGQPLTCLV